MTPVRFLVSLAIMFVVIVCIFPSTTEQAQILDEELRQYFSISRSHIAFHDATLFDNNAQLELYYQPGIIKDVDYSPTEIRAIGQTLRPFIIGAVCSNPVFEDALNRRAFKYVSVNVIYATQRQSKRQLFNIIIKQQRCKNWSP